MRSPIFIAVALVIGAIRVKLRERVFLRPLIVLPIVELTYEKIIGGRARLEHDVEGSGGG